LIVTQEEYMSRLFKLGAGAAVVGAVHILTLLLGWYVEVDEGRVLTLTGYSFFESFLFSTVGGLIAGLGLLIAYTLKKVYHVKNVLGGLATVGGSLAIASPLYTYVFRINALGLKGYPDIGMFIAIFTSLIQFTVGLIILLTPIKQEVVLPTEFELPPTLPETYTVPPATTRRREVARIIQAEDVEEGICTICYYPLSREDAVKCSACGALFHRDCIDAWVSINHICPGCKAYVYE